MKTLKDNICEALVKGNATKTTNTKNYFTDKQINNIKYNPIKFCGVEIQWGNSWSLIGEETWHNFDMKYKHIIFNEIAKVIKSCKPKPDTIIQLKCYDTELGFWVWINNDNYFYVLINIETHDIRIKDKNDHNINYSQIKHILNG